MFSNKRLVDLDFFANPRNWLLSAVSTKLRFGVVCVVQTVFLISILREVTHFNTALFYIAVGYILPLMELHAIRRVLCEPNDLEKEDLKD